MQPMTAEELRNKPEGQNTWEWWNIWSLQELKTADQISDGFAPTVTVEKVELWKEGNPAFYHAQGVKVTDDDVLTPIVTGVGAGTLPALTGSGTGATP